MKQPPVAFGESSGAATKEPVALSEHLRQLSLATEGYDYLPHVVIALLAVPLVGKEIYHGSADRSRLCRDKKFLIEEVPPPSSLPPHGLFTNLQILNS